MDITGKDGEREKVYSQDVENITTAARLPHDPTEQRAVHLLGYRDSEGKGLTAMERKHLTAGWKKQVSRCGCAARWMRWDARWSREGCNWREMHIRQRTEWC